MAAIRPGRPGVVHPTRLLKSVTPIVNSTHRRFDCAVRERACVRTGGAALGARQAAQYYKQNLERRDHEEIGGQVRARVSAAACHRLVSVRGAGGSASAWAVRSALQETVDALLFLATYARRPPAEG